MCTPGVCSGGIGVRQAGRQRLRAHQIHTRCCRGEQQALSQGHETHTHSLSWTLYRSTAAALSAGPFFNPFRLAQVLRKVFAAEQSTWETKYQFWLCLFGGASSTNQYTRAASERVVRTLENLLTSKYVSRGVSSTYQNLAVCYEWKLPKQDRFNLLEGRLSIFWHKP